MPVVPSPAKILVTGASGFLATHITAELLKEGYTVVGTVRSTEKGEYLVKQFDNFGDKFTFVIVPDVEKENAFDEAVKGVSGIAHVATTTGVDPNVVIPDVIAGAIGALKAAAKEPSVKAVVYTSSSMAAAMAKADVEQHIDSSSYNQEAVDAAWAPPPYEMDRWLNVYAASKVAAEKAAWKFMEEEKPGFVLNTILPAANFGKVLFPDKQGYPTTSGWLKDLFEGTINIHPAIPPQHFISVTDAALLHVIALVNPTVQSERLFGFAEPYTWNSILAILREQYPSRTFIADLPGIGKELSTVSNEHAKELLAEWKGKPKGEGFEGLVETVKENVEALA